jgi:electron transfer flavoprotein alpha subunit
MAGIAVLCEVQGGELAKGSLGVLEEAARLGAALGEPVEAIVCGAGLDDAAMGVLGGFGASKVRVADDAALASGIAQPVVDACAAAQESGQYRYWLAGASIMTADAMAGLAARLGAGIVIDAVELHAEGGALVTRRSGLGDSVLAHCGFTTPVGVVVTRANAFAATEGNGGSAPVERFSPTFKAYSQAVQLVGHEDAEDSGPDIGAADVLVTPRASARSRSAPPPSAVPSPRRAPSSTPAGIPTAPRLARPARRSRRSCTSPAASRARSSTRSACRARARSSRSTKTRTRRSSTTPTSASSAISTPSCRR